MGKRSNISIVIQRTVCDELHLTSHCMNFFHYFYEIRGTSWFTSRDRDLRVVGEASKMSDNFNNLGNVSYSRAVA